MIQTIEATIDEDNHIKLSQPVHIKGVHRVLVTILDEAPDEISELDTALLSEQSLATDWERAEEEEAWSHL